MERGAYVRVAHTGTRIGRGARARACTPTLAFSKGALIYHMNVVCAVLQAAFCASRHKGLGNDPQKGGQPIAIYHCSIPSEVIAPAIFALVKAFRKIIVEQCVVLPHPQLSIPAQKGPPAGRQPSGE